MAWILATVLAGRIGWAAPAPGGAAPGPKPSPSPVASPMQALGGARLSLADCLEFARKTHPLLKQKQADYDRGLAQMLQSQALYSDAFKATLSREQTYTFNAGQAAVLLPPLSNTTINLRPIVTFSYPLVDGGKRRWSIERDRQTLLTYACDLRTQWRTLSLDIETDYLDVVYQRDVLDVQQDNVRRTQEVVDEAEGQYRAGRKSRGDVLRARAELTRSQAVYYQQMASLNRAWKVLEATVGSPMNPFAEVDALYDAPPPGDLPVPESIMQIAFSNRSDLLKASYQVEAQKKQIEVDRADVRPTVQGRLDYGFMGQDTPLYNTWTTSVSLTVPLSGWGKVRASNAESRALIRGYLEGAEALRLTIAKSVGSHYVDYNSAALQVQLYQTAVSQGRESYETALQRYRSGLAEFTEVSQTRQELISSQSSLAGARRDRKLAEMQLLSDIERLP